ncbi:HEPN domain-containing protein [Pedobacter cryoconitis]|uniref:HEPN domain-containing protein n=1 Tax=Pedobacter cryoconitis TaxID=188932 RepID=UPI0016109878|nr:HEPN domain-containing protein [Pedobacter cryoconitis]MBB5647661.1 HEPN domain-containing protein [Pedobacter cryoconitis]
MEMHILSAADQQANYFKTFVQSLVEKFQPLQIFCFAKTNLLSENTGCFRDQQNTHHCNYCLLMVTETSIRIDHEVQEFTNVRYRNGNVSIICHGQESILEAIKANSRFFITVYTTGQLLYSYDGMGQFDFTGKFIPTHAANKALKHFKDRMPLAEGFLHGATECLAKQDFKISTFMLHQVVEQCCILLIRVHLGYRSEVHNLLRMLRLCGSFSDKPIKTFLSGSREDERLFDLLMKSYSGSRYGTGYSVSEQDAQSLFERTSFFVSLVRDMCVAKIEELKNEALLHKELIAESEVKVD